MTDQLNDELRKLYATFGNSFTADDVKRRDGYKDKDGEMHEFDYIEWFRFVQVLNEVVPDWTSTIKDIQFTEYNEVKKDDSGKIISSQIKKLCLTTVGLTINGITRYGVGVGEVHETGIKKSEHDGIKRAAIKFNLGLNLYANGRKKQGGYKNNGQKPEWGAPKDQKYLCTDGQFSAMQGRAAKLKVNLDEFVRAMWPNEPDLTAGKLQKRSASYVIDALVEQIKLLEPPAVSEQPSANVTETHQDAPIVAKQQDPQESKAATQQQIAAINRLGNQLVAAGLSKADVFNSYIGKHGSSSAASFSDFTARLVIKEMNERLKELRSNKVAAQ